MATNSEQKSLIPDLPRNPQIIDSNGMLRTEWNLFFDQLILGLQTIFSPEGFKMPQQPAANIASLMGNQSVAVILYDSTNDVFKANKLVGSTPTWVEINTTP